MGKGKHFKCHRAEHPPPTPHPVSLWNEPWLLRHRLQINSRWSISLDVKTKVIQLPELEYLISQIVKCF